MSSSPTFHQWGALNLPSSETVSACLNESPADAWAGFKYQVCMLCQPFEFNPVLAPMVSIGKLQCDFHHMSDLHDADTRSIYMSEFLFVKASFRSHGI